MKEEKSYFVKLFGNYPLIRVLDFFLTFRDFDYPLIEVAENSGVAWSTIHQIFPQLIELGIVKQTRQIGRAKLHMLNKENLLVQQLIEVDDKLMKYFMDIDIAKSSRIPVKIRSK